MLVPQARHGWTGFEKIKMSMLRPEWYGDGAGQRQRHFVVYRRGDSTDTFRRLGVEDSKGTSMPAKLGLNNDHPGHFMICPLTDMSVREYKNLLASLAAVCEKTMKVRQR